MKTFESKKMKKIFLWIGILGLPLWSYAQCESCQKGGNEEIDYCYQNELFAGQCAQFMESANYFYLNGKKKALKVNLPQENQSVLSYVVQLSKDKSLKLKTPDVLFVQEALKTWNVEKRKLGYEFFL